MPTYSALSEDGTILYLSGSQTSSLYTEYLGNGPIVQPPQSNSIQYVNVISYCELPSNCSQIFSQMHSLRDIINLAYIDTRNVENMDYFFAWCMSLRDLDLRSFSTYNVKSMQHMFQSCHSMTHIDTKSLDTRNVEDMTDMFCDCAGYNFTSIDVSVLDTSRVKSMSGMFRLCNNLTDITLGGSFNTSSCETFTQMFRSCPNIQTLDISSFDFSKADYTSEMFAYCDNLKTIISNDLDTLGIPHSTDMFTGCYNLPGYSDSNPNDKQDAHQYGDGRTPVGYFYTPVTKMYKGSTEITGSMTIMKDLKPVLKIYKGNVKF